MEVKEVGSGLCATSVFQDDGATAKATDYTNNEKIVDKGLKQTITNGNGVVIEEKEK